jgi:raffinose/stachyose/melibiose transport system permease protein
MNSFKTRRAIFTAPWLPPLAETFSLEGYETVLVRSSFGQYFVNSLIVTLAAMFLILLLGAMAAFALSEYRFRGNALLGLYLAIGIMIPIRLGTVSILRLVVSLGLVNSLAALILVYTAMGLPLTIFILSQFMRQTPRELKDAARIDGASEYRIFRLVLPLVSPAVATVAVFTIIPIWNDLWFPLILAPGESTKTVTLGAQQFLGQFVSDWNAVLSSLTLAMLPVLIIFILFSRQLIRGLTAGALK